MEEQLRFAQVVISAFLDATLKSASMYLPLFQDHRSAGAWLPKTMYMTRFQDAGYRPLASFMEDVDLTTGTARGATIEGDSLASWREGMMQLRTTGGNDMGFNAVWLGWNNRIAGSDTTKRGRPAAWRITLSDSLRAAWQIDGGSALQLSLLPTETKPGPRRAPRDTTTRSDSSARVDPPTPAATATTPAAPSASAPARDTAAVELSVEFVDAAGVRVLLPLNNYGPLRLPPEMTVRRREGRDRTGFANIYERVLQTFTIPLAHAIAENASFDPARLVSVGLVFDKTVAGTVIVSDIGISNIHPAFFPASNVPRGNAGGGRSSGGSR
jgi:hypothetical protein